MQETQLPQNPDDSGEWKYDLLVDFLLAFGIALNVYLVMDIASDGQLTRDVKAKFRNAHIRYGVWRHKDTIIHEAYETLYEEGNEP